VSLKVCCVLCISYEALLFSSCKKLCSVLYKWGCSLKEVVEVHLRNFLYGKLWISRKNGTCFVELKITVFWVVMSCGFVDR